MIPINDYTIGAEDENDLRSASESSSITYVYLANNIALTNGITIYPNKASFTIDGEYPQNSGTTHIFTDINDSSADHTIGIRATSNIAITIKNMIIDGHNYFGVPYIIPNSTLVADTRGVSVIYENVTYTGPQLTHNRNGFTRYTNCDITIRMTGSSEAQEVGEVNRVEFGGRVRIQHESTGSTRAVIWFCDEANASSLTVLEGADVEITSVNNYFMYNLDGLFLTLVPVTYTVRSGASFTLNVNRGISYEPGHQIASFLVEENASFRYIQATNNGTTASLYVNGALTVGRNARFYMQAANSTEPLIRFTNGTGRSLTVDNPYSFALYCANDPALISLGTTAFTIHGGQLNTWRTPITPVTSAGGFNDTPEFKWFKTNYATPLEVAGTFTQTATTVSSHNLEPEEQTFPITTNLHLHDPRVLSVGDWPVIANPITNDGSPITGWTEPGANIRVVYSIDSMEYMIDETAGPDGNFSVSTLEQVPPEVPAGTQVAIWSNIPFLIKWTLSTAIPVGDLYIVSAPERIVLTFPPISTNPVLLPRTDPRAPVMVSDTRPGGPDWNLLAAITGPLQTADGHTLPDAIVFRYFDDVGDPVLVTLSGTPTPVYTGGRPAEEPIEVSWDSDQGIMGRITEPMHAGVEYTATVNWNLQTDETS